MKTFKQFLESNSLKLVEYEMFFRAHGYDKDDAQAAAKFMLDVQDGNIDFPDEQPIYQKLYDDFSAEMPYDVAKMRNDRMTPDQWLNNEIVRQMKQKGVEA